MAVWERLKAMARAFRQEGLSHNAIAKEIGVSRRTIGDWLSVTNNQKSIGDFCHLVQVGKNRLAKPPTRPLVVC